MEIDSESEEKEVVDRGGWHSTYYDDDRTVSDWLRRAGMEHRQEEQEQDEEKKEKELEEAEEAGAEEDLSEAMQAALLEGAGGSGVGG